MEKTVVINGVEKTLAIDRTPDGYRIAVDGRVYDVSGAALRDGVLNFFVGRRSHRALVSKNDLGLQISLDGRDYVVEPDAVEDAVSAAGRGHGDGSVEAPVPGNVVAVHVQAGDTVRAGESVAVLESMKMHNEITAPVGGEVRAVHCKAGDQVAFGEVLLEIQPAA